MCRFVTLACFVPLAFSGVAFAQQVTVQQPVVAATAVNTTVSVPDRGEVLLGGVSSAASSRSMYGPFRSGTSIGRELQSSNVAARVWIHDLQAMDEYLLNQDVGGTHPALAPATTARDISLDGSRSRAGFAPDTRGASRHLAAPAEPAALAGASSKAEGFYELGLKAEARGDRNVARMHFTMAARHGSPAARARLAKLDAPATAE